MARTKKEEAERIRAADAKWSAAERARAVTEGNVYCAVSKDKHPLAFVRTLAEAEKRRDAFVQEHEVPIPLDYYERQASVDTIEVHVEHHDGTAWVLVGDSSRKVVRSVNFHDGR